MASPSRGPILALEFAEVRSILSIIPMPALVHSMSGGSFWLAVGPNSTRLAIRITSIFYLSMAPILFSPVGGSRDVIPQCVKHAGRNDGFYRRLKWLEAQRVFNESSGYFQGL